MFLLMMIWLTLKEWVKNRPNDLSHPYIIWVPHGKRTAPVSRQTVHTWVTKTERKTNRRITTHDLRRSCITDTLYRTKSHRVAQLIAGHESLGTTTKYIRDDEEKAFELFRNMT